MLADSFRSVFQGKALCIALARKGLFVTVIDLSEENGREVVSLVQKENKHVHQYARVPSAIFIKCDVTNGGKLLQDEDCYSVVLVLRLSKVQSYSFEFFY